VVVGRYVALAQEALASSQSELAAGRLRFAVNRAYYACFYAASALLLAEGRTFVKHAGVRAALHRDLVHPGRLAVSWGELYDELFSARHQADYGALLAFNEEDAGRLAGSAADLVAVLCDLIPAETKRDPEPGSDVK
jgi:hypothetical protein